MLRRISIALCALWLLLGVSALQAQTAKNQRIGILAASAAAASEPNMEALRRRLAELGYREGQNIVFESRTAEGKRERLPALAAELVQLKLDAIIAVGTDAALATEEATASIPIIVVEGPAQPGGNVTGFTQPPRDIIGKLVG